MIKTNFCSVKNNLFFAALWYQSIHIRVCIVNSCVQFTLFKSCLLTCCRHISGDFHIWNNQLFFSEPCFQSSLSLIKDKFYVTFGRLMESVFFSLIVTSNWRFFVGFSLIDKLDIGFINCNDCMEYFSN